jgi:hypothetical protein
MWLLNVRRRAGFLLWAAVQFVVLTTIAMQVYAGGTIWDPWAPGYTFGGNFLSELGATRAWSGHDNHASMVLFSLALGTLGVAFVLFAGAWRGFAFANKRGLALGVASRVFGTLSGLCFLAVSVTPINLALQAHNMFVVAAFGLLLGYAVCTTLVWWRNGAGALELAVSFCYVVFVLAYVGVVVYAVRHGTFTEPEYRLLVLSQKAMAYGSMLYIAFVTLRVRRRIL